MRTGLLRHAVQTLHLRPDAPWPQGCADIRDMVQQWRRLQRARLLESTHGSAKGGKREVETGEKPRRY